MLSNMGQIQAADVVVIGTGSGSNITEDLLIDVPIGQHWNNMYDVAFKVDKLIMTTTANIGWSMSILLYKDSSNYVSTYVRFYWTGTIIQAELYCGVKIGGSTTSNVSAKFTIDPDDWYYFRVEMVNDYYLSFDCKARARCFSDSMMTNELETTGWQARTNNCLGYPFDVKLRSAERYAAMSAGDVFQGKVSTLCQWGGIGTTFTAMESFSFLSYDDEQSGYEQVVCRFDENNPYKVIAIRGDKIYYYDKFDVDEPELDVIIVDPTPATPVVGTWADEIKDDIDTLIADWDKTFELDPLDLQGNNIVEDAIFLGLEIFANVLIIPAFEGLTDFVFETFGFLAKESVNMAQIFLDGAQSFIDTNIIPIGAWWASRLQDLVDDNLTTIGTWWKGIVNTHGPGFLTFLQTFLSSIISNLGSFAESLLLDILDEVELLGDFSGFQAIISAAVSVYGTVIGEIISLEMA